MTPPLPRLPRAWLLASFLALPAIPAAEPPAAPAAATSPAQPAAAAGAEIQIQSDGMEMDMASHLATFIGNVKVTEPRMTLTADKMIVHFDKADKPERIEALGNVLIEQPGEKRQAKAGRAVYTVADGKVVLTEEPELAVGGSILKNVSRIIYDRDTGKIITEGGTLILPGGGGALPGGGILPAPKKEAAP
ncbi:MAG: lipopolysaccharide transport periplasmic protein LptA [Lentisphaeria bacterium]|jgi:lipopolysaccharide transport protein LptA